MADTFFQLYYHIIFAVKNRESYITESIEPYVFKSIRAAAVDNGGLVYAVNGTENHIHMLVSVPPKVSLSTFVQSLKIQSSMVVHKATGNDDFLWQHGFSVFSYSKSLVSVVSAYIENQKKHHEVYTFQSELKSLLDKAGVHYEEINLLKDV